jgi:hypothetical protein
LTPLTILIIVLLYNKIKLVGISSLLAYATKRRKL